MWKTKQTDRLTELNKFICLSLKFGHNPLGTRQQRGQQHVFCTTCLHTMRRWIMYSSMMHAGTVQLLLSAGFGPTLVLRKPPRGRDLHWKRKNLLSCCAVYLLHYMCHEYFSVPYVNEIARFFSELFFLFLMKHWSNANCHYCCYIKNIAFKCIQKTVKQSVLTSFRSFFNEAMKRT